MKTALAAFIIAAAAAGLADGRRPSMLEAPSGTLHGAALTQSRTDLPPSVRLITDYPPEL